MAIRRITAGAAFWAAAQIVWADSLTTIDGKRYEGVYLQKSGAMIYVLVPEDGSVENVLRVNVEDGTLTLSPREDRAQLLAQWREARGEGEGPTYEPKPVLTYEDWKRRTSPSPPANDTESSVSVNPNVRKHGIRAFEQRDGTLQLTNRPGKLAKRSKGRTVYVDENGVGLLTNLHEQFADSSEYIAIQIPFELIDVPEQFLKLAEGVPLGSSKFDEIIAYYARKYQLESNLVYAVIRQESNFNPSAVSPAGASGLMQLMPGTAAEMGVTDIFDPVENIAGGTQYLAQMFRMFDNNLTLALAAYNAGPGNVMKYNGVPPFTETQNYVRRVKALQRQYSRRGHPRVTVPVDGRQGAPRLASLPEADSEYIRFVLHGGGITTAEEINERDTYYTYRFRHRTGVIQKKFVKEVIYPVKTD